MKTLYEALLEAPADDNILVHRWGEGTEFEAVARIFMDDDTRDWDGILVFKDERFSPCDETLPQLQYKYPTPVAANGALAMGRAERLWETLTGIFAALRQGDMDGWKTEYTRTDVETGTILILTQGYGLKWNWVLDDLETEGGINSSAFMFDTREDAASAGLSFYADWLAHYQSTGDRTGPPDE